MPGSAGKAASPLPPAPTRRSSPAPQTVPVPCSPSPSAWPNPMAPAAGTRSTSKGRSARGASLGRHLGVVVQALGEGLLSGQIAGERTPGLLCATFSNGRDQLFLLPAPAALDLRELAQSFA